MDITAPNQNPQESRQSQAKKRKNRIREGVENRIKRRIKKLVVGQLKKAALRIIPFFLTTLGVVFLLMIILAMGLIILGGFPAPGSSFPEIPTPPPTGPGGGGGGSGGGPIPVPLPLPIDAASCPIPGGTPSCGSKAVLRNGCGHCSPAYMAIVNAEVRALCNLNRPIKYALDVPANYEDPVFLPTVGGKRIRWTGANPFEYKQDEDTAFLIYNGLDEDTGEQYRIRFHHSLPGSGAGKNIVLYSGAVGARVCRYPCRGYAAHTHIVFGILESSGALKWVDAPQYFCN